MKDVCDEILDFLIAWRGWVNDGAPQDKPFRREYGLCTNMDEHMGQKRLPSSMVNFAHDTISEWFKEEFGSREHPFGKIDYGTRKRLSTQHESKERLAWVDKTIKELT